LAGTSAIDASFSTLSNNRSSHESDDRKRYEGTLDTRQAQASISLSHLGGSAATVCRSPLRPDLVEDPLQETNLGRKRIAIIVDGVAQPPRESGVFFIRKIAPHAAEMRL
jgi:hypothetical protein